MDITTFTDTYREAFGRNAPLPIAFWYASEAVAAPVAKTGGCFFQLLGGLMLGEPASLTAESIGCSGGKFYTGFTGMPSRVPDFVSRHERYKRTPGMVSDHVRELGVPVAPAPFLNLSRVDNLPSFDGLSGLLFLATPDILSGLAAWVFFDNNAADAVVCRFGSGCSSVITDTVVENARNGRRTFVALLDPSVRRHVPEAFLGFAVPMSRFREMCGTMRDCCLFAPGAWERVRERIEAGRLFQGAE